VQRQLCCAEATFHFKFNITSFKDIPGAPDVKQRFILFRNGVHQPGVYVETPAFKLVAKKDDRDKPARMAGVKLPGIKQALEKAEKGLTDACQYADDVHGYQEILRLVQTALQRLQRVAAQPGDAVPTKQNPFPDIPRYSAAPSLYNALVPGRGGCGGGCGGACPSTSCSAASPAAAALGGLEALMMAADSRTAGAPEDPLCAQESLGCEETMQPMPTLMPGRGLQGGGGSNGPLVKRQRTMDMADALLLTTDEQLVRPPPPLPSPFTPLPHSSHPPVLDPTHPSPLLPAPPPLPRPSPVPPPSLTPSLRVLAILQPSALDLDSTYELYATGDPIGGGHALRLDESGTAARGSCQQCGRWLRFVRCQEQDGTRYEMAVKREPAPPSLYAQPPRPAHVALLPCKESGTGLGRGLSAE